MATTDPCQQTRKKKTVPEGSENERHRGNVAIVEKKPGKRRHSAATVASVATTGPRKGTRKTSVGKEFQKKTAFLNVEKKPGYRKCCGAGSI